MYFVSEVHLDEKAKVEIIILSLIFEALGNLKTCKISVVHEHFHNHSVPLLFYFISFKVSHHRFLKYIIQNSP